MRSAYRILAIIIAVEVVIQAMAMVFAVAGLGIWVDEGGMLDKAAFESEDLELHRRRRLHRSTASTG